MGRAVLAIAVALLTAARCMGAELTSAQQYSQATHVTPDREHGERIFRNRCEVCHGEHAEGYPGGQVAAFPVIAGQHFRYLIVALIQFRNGRNSPHGMQYSADTYSLTGAQDVADVAAYVATLLPPAAIGKGDGLSLGIGARVYLRECEACHGATGAGNPDTPVPRLAAQHYRYLLHQLDAGADPRLDSGTHSKRIMRLTAQERAAVADYLSRLLPPAVNGN